MEPIGAARASYVQIWLFGSPRLAVQGAPLRLRGRRKNWSLLAYLLLHRDRPINRDVIAYDLWPDLTPFDARVNLRRHLHDLLQQLPPTPTDQPWALHSPETIQWNPFADIWLDIAEFESLAADANAAARGAELYVGDLLADTFEEWLVAPRERLRQCRLNQLQAALNFQLAAGNLGVALEHGLQLVQLEPLREDFAHHVMRLRYLNGDRLGALRQFSELAAQLDRDLGVEPTEATVALHQTILANLPMILAPQPGQPERTVAPAPESASAPPATLPLVGRSGEIDMLRTMWGRAIHGQGGVALVSGEAGIGKSRLVAELRRVVASEGGQVLIGGAASGEPTPLQTVVEALRSALPAIQALDLAPSWRRPLLSLLPALQTERIAAETTTWWDTAGHRRELFAAVAHLFRQLSQQRPVFCVFEDIHWAGESTLELIGHLAAEASAQPALFVLTFRDQELSREHPLWRLRRRLLADRLAQPVALARLSLPDVVTVIEQTATVADAERRIALAQQFRRASDGNPFFLGELLRDFQESHSTLPTANPTPDQLTDGRPIEPAPSSSAPPSDDGPTDIVTTISRRLSRLSPSARRLAEVGAVAGEAFNLETVREVLGWSNDQARSALDELVDHNVAHYTSAGDWGDYTFTHHLIQSAIYGEIPADQRRWRHLRIAQITSDLYPDRANELAGRLARHFDVGGDAASARQAYLRSATRLREAYAYVEARAALRRGIELEPDSRELAEFWLQLVAVTHGLSDGAAEKTVLDQLAALSAELRDPDVNFTLGHGQFQYGRLTADRAMMALGLATIQSALEARPDAGREATLWRLTMLFRIALVDLDGAREAGERAAWLAAQAGARPMELSILASLAEVASLQGRLDDAQAYLEVVLTENAIALSAEFLETMLTHSCVTAYYRQEFRRAYRVGQQVMTLPSELRAPKNIGDAKVYMGMAACFWLDLVDAKQLIDGAEAEFQRVENRTGLMVVQIARGVFALEAGELALAERIFAELYRLFRERELGYYDMLAGTLLALAQFEQGVTPDADTLEYCLHEAERYQGQFLTIPYILGYLSDRARAAGCYDNALKHARGAVEIARRSSLAPSLPFWLATVALAQAAGGDREAAIQTLGEATTVEIPDDLALHAAVRQVWRLARAFRAVGDQATARHWLDHAHRLFRLHLERLTSEAARSTYQAIPGHAEMLLAHTSGVWPNPL